MKPLWLLGEHIERSLSPLMHNAALDALSLPKVYALKPCNAAGFAAAFAEASATCRGVNITAPHKRAAAALLKDARVGDALQSDVVNTVVFLDDGAAAAYNTDVVGLREAWRRAAVDLRDADCAVIGAGASARSTVVALSQARAKRVRVHARRPEAAAELVALATSLGLEAAPARGPEPTALVVVSVPAAVDAAPLLGAVARPHSGVQTVVHDLRYGAAALATRNAALAAGHFFVDGTTLLLGQGTAALSLFLGETNAPLVAREAMTRALAAATHLSAHR